MNEEGRYSIQTEKIKLTLIYAAFGTIGIVTHFIRLSSPGIVFYRAILGSLFIIVAAVLSGRTIDIQSMKNNFPVLVATGFFMGLNWVLQFEAFRVSSVAIGTVCYNTMPIFLIIFASIFFKEKITLKTLCCIIIAIIGVILVSNIMSLGFNSNIALGCFYGLLGAIFYALILIYNRKLDNIKMHDKIIFQFSFSALIMAVYILIIDKNAFWFDKNITNNDLIISVICILLLGLFHTGFCYIHYFNAVKRLKAETVAILTFIDPVVALFLSFFLLKESMTPLQLLGSILILSAALANELLKTKNKW